MVQQNDIYWHMPINELLERFQSSLNGISNDEAKKRLSLYGINRLKPKNKTNSVKIFLSQFNNPIILILIFTAILAYFLQDPSNTFIILAIIILSSFLGFWEERRSSNAIEKLLSLVHIKVSVIRDGKLFDLLIDDIVPGDVIYFSAGNTIPADCIILESKDLFVNEATLTGETFPVEKRAGIIDLETPLNKRINVLFMGTNVISGAAKTLVFNTGRNTEFGKISERLKLKSPETEFTHGIKKFGYFLMIITLSLVISILIVNVYFSRPILSSFLFALALAVGLTPQLLPVIISINLSRGAKKMADYKVIVKQLNSIENIGSMNILCSDKTGTITEGLIQFNSALDINGEKSEKAFLYGYINAFYQSGYVNPIDEAIKNYKRIDISTFKKLDEIPYDFIRKRLSMLVLNNSESILITKGAMSNILSVCSYAEISQNKIFDISEVKEQIQHKFEDLSNRGFRILGIAYKKVDLIQEIKKEDEFNLIFLGHLVLFDPIKSDIVDTINDLHHLGVSLKIITGDNKLISNSVAQQIGFLNPKIITGQELRQISDEALIKLTEITEIFAEVEPNQKERIILALKKANNVVGYMGDGINDASALHAADVGISVNNAADVAKEAAAIVLLDKDLKVLIDGIKEGRKTFANTMKYINITTSANFGNMFSMAGFSLLLPYLPMLPRQILLTNLITDFPAITIASDNVDQEQITSPKRWNIKFIRNFMLYFGILSTLFDFLTFFIFIFVLHATQDQFRTGWFILSVVTELLILLVIRTQKPIYKSKPSKIMLTVSSIIAIFVIILIYTPFGTIMGFTALSFQFTLILFGIVFIYLIANEIGKKLFYKLMKI